MNYELVSGLVGIGVADVAEVLNARQNITVFIEKGLDTARIGKKIKNATGLVICMQGSREMLIRDYQKIVESLAEHVDEDAEIVWGAQTGKANKLLVMAGW